jgi:hypothetical protein
VNTGIPVQWSSSSVLTSIIKFRDFLRRFIAPCLQPH